MRRRGAAAAVAAVCLLATSACTSAAPAAVDPTAATPDLHDAAVRLVVDDAAQTWQAPGLCTREGGTLSFAAADERTSVRGELSHADGPRVRDVVWTDLARTYLADGAATVTGEGDDWTIVASVARPDGRDRHVVTIALTCSA